MRPRRPSRPPVKASGLYPSHPQRICWGCERHCPHDRLACGNGSERTSYPSELFGEDWLDWAAARER